MTAELAMRLEMAEAVSYESRLRAIQVLRGNPMGIELRRFGNVAARLMRDNPSVNNRVQGLTPRDEDRLDEIVAWFSERGQHVRLVVSPFHANRHLLTALMARGFAVSGFGTVLYGVPTALETPLPQGATVREVPFRGLDVVADVAAEDARWNRPDVREDLRALYRQLTVAQFQGEDRADWHLYLASVDGTPAAVAALHVRDGVGTLTFDGTISRFRGRGCQTALIRQRIADAAALACDLVVTQTAPGSTSQRNMERAGLRTAYTHAIWSRSLGERG